MKDSNPDGGSRSSFVSKYLHFHAPDAIPIFDSLAKRGLQSQTKGFRTALKKPSNYERFCERLAHLIERKGMDGDSLRAIDKWLVIEGRKLKNAKGE